MAKYDLSLTWNEFEDLTPAMFQALCKRRNIRIRYERFANAQTAAAVYNTNRHSVEDPLVEPFDFIRDDESAQRKERLMKAKRYINRALGAFPLSTTREKILEIRQKAITDLKASGYADAEQIVNAMYPNLQSKD